MKQHSTPQIGNAGRSRTLQALWLALANLLSLSVTLVMQAVLCRYMTTSEYGTYSQVLYVYNTLLAVFSLGLPKAYSYYLARVSPEEGRDIVRKLNGLFLLLASVFSCILLWQAAAIAGVLGNPLLAEPLRLFAAAPMLLMPVLGVENILVVYGKAHLVAVYVLISRAFMIACVVLPVVVFDAGVSGAVAGFVLASLVTCVAGLKLSSVPFRNVSPVKSRLTVRELLRFSMPVFASSMYGFGEPVLRKPLFGRRGFRPVRQRIPRTSAGRNDYRCRGRRAAAGIFEDVGGGGRRRAVCPVVAGGCPQVLGDHLSVVRILLRFRS